MRRSVPLSRVGIGLAGGLVFAVFVMSVWNQFPDPFSRMAVILNYIAITTPFSSGTVPTGAIYVVLGLFATGGVLAVLVLEYRVVSPIVVVGGSLGAAWVLTWEYTIVRPPTPFTLYLLGWPLVVGGMVVGGRFERSVIRSDHLHSERRSESRYDGEDVMMTRWQLGLGAMAGFLASLVSYGLIMLFLLLDGATWSAHDVLNSRPRFAGILFFNAHFVEVRVEGDGGNVGWHNLLLDPGYREALTSTIPAFVYFVTPLLVLVLTGYLLFRVTSRFGTAVDRSRTLGVGLSLVPGYLITSAAGIVTSQLGTGFDWYNPVVLSAIVICGVVFPVFAGTVGALIDFEARRRRVGRASFES